jgi:hypothetical protein
MKMHLVMTTALAALCSQAAFAASEGGDTWSALQPQADTRSMQSPLPLVATSVSPGSLQRGFPMAASEGGDTWSALQARDNAGLAQSAMVATSASSSGSQRGFPVAASEGGDTWSELQPRLSGDATPSLMSRATRVRRAE